jgi:hypothetical protein
MAHTDIGTAIFPAAEFTDRLDALVAAAAKAGISSRQIANTLTERADAERLRFAMTAPADSAF